MAISALVRGRTTRILVVATILALSAAAAVAVAPGAAQGAPTAGARRPAALPPPPTPTPIPPTPGTAYWMTAADGQIGVFGDPTGFFGAMTGPKNAPIVAIASTPDGVGYWQVGADGGVFAFGDARFHGSLGGRALNSPIDGLAATPSGDGYWLVAGDGGVFAFGDAKYFGSMGGRGLASPIVAIAATPSGDGYWLVGGDGGVFAFGAAKYHGSMAGRHLAAPVVGVESTESGDGYRLASADGGVFAFGDAEFQGSMANRGLVAPIVATAPDTAGDGYLLAGADGGSFAFGHAAYAPLSIPGLPQPIVAMAPAGLTMPDAAMSGCDVLETAPAGHDCLLPWPNDAFSVPSDTTVSGRRLAISSAVDPTNAHGVHVATTAQNQEDGFSPGSVIMAYVPHLDLAASGISTSTDIDRSTDAGNPIVVLDTATGVKVPYFAELDAQTANTAEQLLLIHPAVALTEGHRYAVVLRGLFDTSGHRLPPLPSTIAALNGTLEPESRAAHIRWVIRQDLRHVLVDGAVPYLAWDFTVASANSLAGPALRMHTLAYQWLNHGVAPGDGPPTEPAPPFTVTSVTTTSGVRDVHGTFEVPLFLQDTTEYSAMHTDASGMPAINGNKVWTANFICVLPTTVQAGGPATPTVYGHGLLGSASEVEGSSFSGDVGKDMMGCATDWIGLSDNDIGNVVRTLGDISSFDTLVDHMLQGFVNFQFLGRLINAPSGFATNAAFQDGSGHSLFRVGDCHYMGYSQGGIMGGAVSTLSSEWTRVMLGVPGMDYGGLLLDRSVDWNEFAAVYGPSYPNPVDQQIVLQLAQLLWDRGEADGYAQHLTYAPYRATPGIPAKQVFILENYGDHQVANVSAEMFARTILARNHQPAFNPSFFGAPPRLDVPDTPQWGLEPLDQTTPVQFGGLVLWDYGTPTPPTVNLAPNGAQYGSDPHGDGRDNPLVLDQISAFLTTGVIPDECGGAACQSTSP